MEDSRILQGELNQLIKERPERVGAYLLSVQLALSVNDLARAISIVEGGMVHCSEDRLRVQLAILKSVAGKHEQAISMFHDLIAEEKENPELLFAYGRSLSALNKFEESIRVYKKCLSIAPTHNGALNNLASLYYQLEDFKQAEALYQRLLKMAPSNALGYLNTGNLSVKQGKFELAMQHFHKAIEMDSGLAEAYFNLGQLHANVLHQKEEGMRWYERGLEEGRGDLKTIMEIHYLLLKWQLAHWSNYEQERARMQSLLQEYLKMEGGKTIVPYELSHVGLDGPLYKQVAIKYAKKLKNSAKVRAVSRSYDHSIADGKMKIGYYSPKFRLHPGGLLVRTLFEHHDRSQFEIHAFSLVASSDQVATDISESVDYFHDVSEYTSVEIADLINRTGIDVLVALAGYNFAMKLDVLAFKPAPIQIMTLGSHETTGADFVDYVFSDTYLIDDDLKSNYTEAIITLPCSIMFNCELPDLGEPSPTNRNDHGLPDDKFVFASFNDPRKLDPETAKAWGQILKKTPNAVLWLYQGDGDQIGERLLAYFEKLGVLDQIILAKKVELKQHWERIKHADAVLDCFNYNAHFTAIECLRQGVPMITLKGSTHNSRLGASMLHFAGLGHLVMETKEAYIRNVITIANEAHSLEMEIKSLTDGGNQELFNEWMQVKYLEKAYRMAAQNHKKGHLHSFNVSSSLPFDSK